MDRGWTSRRHQNVDCRRLRGVRGFDSDPALANHRHIVEPVGVLPRCWCCAAGSGSGRAPAGKLVESRHGTVVGELCPMNTIDNIIGRVPPLPRYILAAVLL